MLAARYEHDSTSTSSSLFRLPRHPKADIFCNRRDAQIPLDRLSAPCRYKPKRAGRLTAANWQRMARPRWRSLSQQKMLYDDQALCVASHPANWDDRTRLAGLSRAGVGLSSGTSGLMEGGGRPWFAGSHYFGSLNRCGQRAARVALTVLGPLFGPFGPWSLDSCKISIGRAGGSQEDGLKSRGFCSSTPEAVTRG